MRTLLIDFDGVVHLYTSKWSGDDVIQDGPVPGAFEWITEMHRTREFTLCIYSSRSKNPAGVEAMKTWFRLHGLPEYVLGALRFPTEKPAAWLTIDDRGFHFEGTFPTAEFIMNFKPWNKQ